MDAALRQHVRRRAGSRCEYCQVSEVDDDTPFEVDHVLPTVHGGQTVADNLALACFPCNSFKVTNLAGIDATSKRVTRLFHPRRDRWSAHFLWRGPVLVGLTGIGRATVATLRINLQTRVQLRGELIEAGVFPPNP